MSFAPGQLATSIRRLLPDFAITHVPDFRQDIADTWPRSIDYSVAAKDWNWEPTYDLDDMTRDVLEQFLPQKKNEDDGDEDNSVDLEILLQRQHFGGGSSLPMI